MKDSTVENEKTIRELTLIMQQEAHYHHTLMDVVELMVVYGYDKVIGDLKETIRVKEPVKGGIQC